MSRAIAIIGTAGRDKDIKMSMKHWEQMCKVVHEEVEPTDTLVSGGAAWADHVAVWAYLNGYCKDLILHLPAPFMHNGYIGGYGTSGGAANYYHGLFTQRLGVHTMGHITLAIRKGAKVTEQPAAHGYSAMANRNKLVANDCTHMIAFTFGEGSEPADGGTKITWDMAKDKQRVHVTLER